ncbi:MAG: trypsin-like peptidase domain-containing protein [Candidatus Bathyarchaeota archaeon]|nr:trypsin-like peptidase domain-containing protein [Candidatus Bathyarchaeota archaeon]
MMESQPETQPTIFPSIPPPPVEKKRRFSGVVLVVLLLVGLVAGGLIGYAVTYNDFNSKLTNLQSQLGMSQGSGGSTFLLNENVSLATLYSNVKSSVVVIQNLAPGFTMFGQRIYTLQQGSGFVAEVNSRPYVVTNNHVVTGTINVTVTFSDGNSYPATIVGQDPKADIAVLSVTSMPSGVKALPLVSSLTLNVGDPVVAVGTPYGLSGTLTTGIISALGRTITVGSDNQIIPDTIQTSTPINSGNSGGPLINYAGQVVGITTAGISNSEGLGFAIPSSTLMRVLPSLVSSGSYDQHPSINTVGTDMNYPIAQAMGAPVTYGYLVESVSAQNGLQGGNTVKAVLNKNVVVGGDIIVAIGNTRIANTDDLLSYLERHTLPGQTVTFTVVRNGQTQSVQVTIGKA